MERRRLFVIVLGVVVVLSLVAAGLLRAAPKEDGRPGAGRVGLVRVEGVLVAGAGGQFAGMTASAEEVAAQLDRARRDPNLRAVVLRINSPGGSAAAAQEITRAIERLRGAGKPVVASLGDTAASGGYWIAAAADRIVANPASLTGSIGVIIETANLAELYRKLGIGVDTVKSGPYKDMGSPARPLAPEERAIFQSMVNDVYQQFLDVVCAGRHMDRERVRGLADGRVFTGRQALEVGLVDQLGDLHEAIRWAAKAAGVPEEPVVVELTPRPWWYGLLRGIEGLVARWLPGRPAEVKVW